jgi:cysteine synthase B
MVSAAPDDIAARVAGASVVDAIGSTPLVRLTRVSRTLRNVELYAKLEARNPGGSVKDRAARRIVLDGERSGALGQGRILLDATSGNTGIAYAMLGAARGHRVTLCMPDNVSSERKRILEAYGANVVITSALEGSDGAIREARRLAHRFPDRYFYADQYGNESNWQAHYETTAPEIFAQTAGRVTHLVAGLGTSGTFVGTGRRLRELRPDIRLVSVQPAASFHGLDGLKHMASAIVPPIYDPALADENLGVETEDAHRVLWRLWRDEGLFVGVSSGAALAGALRVAERSPGAVIVCIFPDGGDRYLSSGVWNDRP